MTYFFNSVTLRAASRLVSTLVFNFQKIPGTSIETILDEARKSAPRQGHL
jgi:hypothetical protein